MIKKINTWFKNNYSIESIVARLRWSAASIGAIVPINALTEKQLRNTATR